MLLPLSGVGAVAFTRKNVSAFRHFVPERTVTRKKRKSRARSPAPERIKPFRRKSLFSFVLPLVLVGVLTVTACMIFRPKGSSDSKIDFFASPYSSLTKITRKAGALDELLKMMPSHLAGIDIAEMNLLCATGLPGAEALDINRSLARLDEWAGRVKLETDRHVYRAYDPRWADHYKHSEAWLRAEMLAQVLQEDCGVHYNMERIRNIDFTRSKDLFIHGMIDDDNGGTCVSMPVLYVAVGRRLGYPLKLVLTKAHVFTRWDDGKQRFNIEVTGNGGTDSYPDEHYKTWPMKWTPQEAKTNCYLKSLSPAEELACFLASRGHCLLDNGRVREARDAYAAAHGLAPKNLAYLAWARQAQRRLRPPTFAGRGGFREPPMVYRRGPFSSVEAINAYNRRMMERRLRPPGPPRPPSPYPGQPGVPKPHQPPEPKQPTR